MPDMRPGTRGGPVDPSNLRETGRRKQPYIKWDPRAKLYHAGVEVKPQTLYAMDRITAVFFKRGLPVIWTSIVRPESPRRFSLHPFGYGVDADTDRTLNAQVWHEIGQDVAKEVGPEYDILVHNDGSGMHLHGEFDPEDDEHWLAWKAARRAEWEERHAEDGEPEGTA